MKSHIPLSKPKGKEAHTHTHTHIHTHKLTNTHARHAQQIEWTALSQTDDHLATLIINGSNNYIYLLF